MFFPTFPSFHPRIDPHPIPPVGPSRQGGGSDSWSTWCSNSTNTQTCRRTASAPRFSGQNPPGFSMESQSFFVTFAGQNSWKSPKKLMWNHKNLHISPDVAAPIADKSPKKSPGFLRNAAAVKARQMPSDDEAKKPPQEDFGIDQLGVNRQWTSQVWDLRSSAVKNQGNHPDVQQKRGKSSCQLGSQQLQIGNTDQNWGQASSGMFSLRHPSLVFDPNLYIYIWPWRMQILVAGILTAINRKWTNIRGLNESELAKATNSKRSRDLT